MPQSTVSGTIKTNLLSTPILAIDLSECEYKWYSDEATSRLDLDE
jgi:hypothetical protein